MTKVSSDVLVESYKRLGNVWRVAEEVGLCGQSVHERLKKMGRITPVNVWTKEEEGMLLKVYSLYRDKGELDVLAKKFNRPKTSLCKKAKELGLTNRKSPRTWSERHGANPYNKYHARVRSLRGTPKKCEVCGEESPKKWYEWASKTGKYEDPFDYVRMCRACHRQHDRKKPPRRAHI